MQRIRENKSGTFDLMHQNARVFLTGPSGMPSVVFSVIRFQDSRKNRKRSTGGYVYVTYDFSFKY